MRRNLVEWYQDEYALSHSRMRNLQPGLGDLQVAKEQNVQIESARPICESQRPVTAKLLLDGKQRLQQLLRLQLRLQCNDSIDETRLLGKSHRLG